jgi:photosystem II stability/assembly factor-like uncharacterized protein
LISALALELPCGKENITQTNGIINDMRNRYQMLFVAFAISTGLISLNISITSAVGPSTKSQRAATFVGGDIHTLTFTKNGLFVTGHEGGSLSTNEGMKWKSVASFKNSDIMGWATTDSGYLAGGHNGLFRSSNGGKSFSRVSFYGKASDVHSLGATAKNVYMGSPQVGFLRSTNGGKSWKVVNRKFGQQLMGSMLVDPANPLRVIAPDMNNGVVTTADGGKSWTRFGGPSGVMSIDWNPKNHKEIVALSMGVGSITKNNGKTWSTFRVPMGSSALAIASDGLKLFVAALAGDKAEIFSSTDMGKSWV